MVNSTTGVFDSPFKYVQGSEEFNHLPEYSKPCGKACAIIDSSLYAELNQKLENIHGKSEGKFFSICFKGERCDDEVQRTYEIARSSGAVLTVGVGGGKTLDIAKPCADSADLPVIIAPASASTDVPVSEITVFYAADGEYIGLRKMKHNVHLVLVGSGIIVETPRCLPVAGMGDALATYPKVLACQGSDSSNYTVDGRRRCKISMAIAKSSWGILFSDRRSVLIALERGVITKPSENAIKADTLLGGLGFLNIGLVTVHGIHPGLTMIPSTHKYPHGEKVAFDIVRQMVMKNTPTETMDKVTRFTVDTGLPVMLEQLDMEPIEESITAIARKTADGPLVHQKLVLITEKTVYDTILMADELGRKYRGM